MMGGVLVHQWQCNPAKRSPGFLERLIRFQIMPRLFRFAIVGGIATCVHLSTAWMVFNWFTRDSTVANIVAFVVANIVSFLLQTLWSFSSKPTLARFLRFGAVSTIGFSTSALVPSIFGRQHLWAPTIIVVCCIPVFSYIAHARWTYRNAGQDESVKKGSAISG
jgi:putative flippase GtrA